MVPTPRPALVTALLSHRLPLPFLVTKSKASTRIRPPAYDTLRNGQLAFALGGDKILPEFHETLRRAAPILSERDPLVADRFTRFRQYAHEHRHLPIHSEPSLAAFLFAVLLFPINLHLVAVNGGSMPPLYWELSSSREGTASPDFCVRLMRRGRPGSYKSKTIATIELKTSVALPCSECFYSLAEDFKDGKLVIDKDGRAVPAEQAGKKRRRVPKVCHLVDQGHTHLVQLDSKLAILTNYEIFVVLRRDLDTFQISDPVSWEWSASDDCLAASPLGLMLGITCYASEMSKYLLTSSPPPAE